VPGAIGLFAAIIIIQNGFPFTFQTQITFWILGGTNIVVDGGGTLDGAGQASGPLHHFFFLKNADTRPGVV
jgi:hypothetical protein